MGCGGAGPASQATSPQGNTNADAGQRGVKVQREEWATRQKYQSIKGTPFGSTAGLKCTWNCLFKPASEKRLFKIQMMYKTEYTGLQPKQDFYSFDLSIADV